MSVFLLIFMCLSCFAADDSNGWSCVKSSTSRLAGAVNPFDESSVVRRLCGSVLHAKGNAIQNARVFVGDLWWKTDRLHKAEVLLLGGIVVSGLALKVMRPPAYVHTFWGIVSLSLSGGIFLGEAVFV